MTSVADAVLTYARRTVRLLPAEAAVTSAVVEGQPADLMPHLPRLVRGFAAERMERAALLRAACWAGEPPGAVRKGGPSGCSVVQSLPALARELTGTPMAGRADGLAAAADRLHWTLAETPPTGPAAVRRAADAYELCYGGACCLWLWRTRPRSREQRPWAYGAVDVVLDRLVCGPAGSPAPFSYLSALQI
jgi:hypothetical protein